MWRDQDQTSPDSQDPRDPYRGPPAEQGPYWPTDSRDMGSMPTDPNTAPPVYPDPYPGSRNRGNPPYGGYNADGTPYRPSTPAYVPDAPRYPGGRPPQWPGAQQPVQPAVEPRAPIPPQRRQQVYQPASAQYQGAAQPTASRERRSPAGHALPHLPVAHIILALGVLAMGLALSQVWGVTSSGTAVYIQDFTNARIQQHTNVDTGALALQTATFLVGAVAVLSAALILFNLVITLLNKTFGLLGLSGCATLLFIPVLWGVALLLFVALLASAGFAGISYLSRIPLVNENGLAIIQVSQYGIGFYAWCGGIVAVFIGMLGQLALRRR